jgi:DNA-binding LytR/AlgR family response regulator
MLKIAVCDDQEMELKILELHLDRYQQLRQCGAFEVRWYTSSAELVKQLQAGEHYDLFILDMMMPEYNGVEVGRAIRDSGLESAIIYITASADFALDAIRVHPEEYLLKPLNTEALYQALDVVLERLENRSRQFLTVKTRAGMQAIPCQEIVCVEHAGRVAKFHMENQTALESVYLRAPFEVLVEPLLRQTEFIQTHKSYLVNLRHVRTLQPANMVTDTGMEIPISRRNAAEVKQRYTQFLAGHTTPTAKKQ